MVIQLPRSIIPHYLGRLLGELIHDLLDFEEIVGGTNVLSSNISSWFCFLLDYRSNCTFPQVHRQKQAVEVQGYYESALLIMLCGPSSSKTETRFLPDWDVAVIIRPLWILLLLLLLTRQPKTHELRTMSEYLTSILTILYQGRTSATLRAELELYETSS